MYGESNIETYVTICKIDSQICCMAQETQTGALYQPKGVGLEGRWAASVWLIRKRIASSDSMF